MKCLFAAIEHWSCGRSSRQKAVRFRPRRPGYAWWVARGADEWRGHKGKIYYGAGWEYCGETKPEAVYTINGRMVARKAGGKTRTHAEMLGLGAVFEGRFKKHRFCLRNEMPEVSA
jgi:hypothetical protein